MKLAYFSPLPPQKSGISDYSEGLLRYLQDQAEVDLWVAGLQPIVDLPRPVRVIDYGLSPAALRRLEAYDLAVYHMGNNPLYHSDIFRVLTSHPGLVVLHDYSLLDFFLQYHLMNRRNPDGFVELMAVEYGPAGRAAARDLLNPATATRPDRLHYSLNGPVVRNALGVVVHSRFVRRLLRNSHVGVPVRQINHGTETPKQIKSAVTAVRGKFSLPQDKVLIGCFGFAVPSKRLDVIFRSLAHSSLKESLLVLVVGEDVVGVRDLAASCGAEGFVRHIDFVTNQEFDALICAVDVCVNLRYPTMGETSGSLCRALACGKPAVVSNVGWYAELPDDCVVKIPVDSCEESAVREAVERLAQDSRLRQGMGQRARAYMRATHSWEASARRYLDFMQDIVSGKAASQMAMARDVGETLQKMGVRPSDRQMIKSIAEAGLSVFRSGSRP